MRRQGPRWRLRAIAWPTIAAGALVACSGPAPSPPLFDLVSPGHSGITFVNELAEAPEINILNYLNYYNGAGVAAGDVDGDGLVDLYFTSNLGTDRLYRNTGDFTFEDVTQSAGLGDTHTWTTGVTMADVNADGHLDLYVSAVSHLTLRGGNVLYINNGDGTFTDRTAAFGLEHVGYSTQAAFFDYDSDGDLDMYLLNHSTHAERGRVFNPQRTVRHPRAGDRLFRNDGNRFVDVSEEAGIFGGVEGYGLGVVVSDLDVDGCPDIFVANDFHENDFLYYSNCDGTFAESIATATGHTSLSSMGVDAADVTNDLRPDVMVLDMLPAREEILKSSVNAEDFTVFALTQQYGFHAQFIRNTLQINRGRRRFSEVGYLAGVYATDWSWSPLFADLDNDADKDVLVTNGIYRRPNDLDYIAYVTDRSVQAMLDDGVSEADLSILDSMPHVPIPNYVFRNDGDLRFTNVAQEWGLGQPGFSTGATYVDLDNDGALDLVVNNINDTAAVYRNRARERNGHHYLTVRLRGEGGNRDGIGTKVVVAHGGTRQLLESMPTRGFQSAVDQRLHFGLGESMRIDSLTVIWPDRRFEVLRNLDVDREVTLVQQEASGRWQYADRSPSEPWFENLPSPPGLEVRHEENTFFDYNREPLIPHQVSREGPALAVGDVDGDGRDDVYVGGAKWQPGRLLVQQPDGGFRSTSDSVFGADSLHEDVDAAFFDANGDGALDLYVVSAGNEFWDHQDPLRDRLYLNDGDGAFRRAEGSLPDLFENGSCVVPADFDRDGDVDLFVGSRVVSRRYGEVPRSALLRNDGTGRFDDATEQVAPGLAEAGMVTSAAWVDYDGDDLLDLVVVGEWMPVKIFRQQNGRFEDRTADAGLAGSEGWWNHVTVADLQDDGRPDLVLGNLGLNSRLEATADEPVRLYVHDFANNGSLEQILTYYRNGKSYPLAGRDALIRVMPGLAERYPTYADFAGRRIEDIIPASELRRARTYEAHVFANSIAVNLGDGTFELRSLPTMAQLAPVYAALPGDFDGDGNVDVIVAGNFSGVPPVIGQYDASYGLLLRGDGGGGLVPVDLEESGLELSGEVRDLQFLRRSPGGVAIVAARNNDRLQVVRPLRMVGAGAVAAAARARAGADVTR